MSLILSSIQQALLFLPLAIGIYISYRILAVVDLTVDGTFVLGAAVFAKLITNNFNQYISLIIALLAGAIIGGLVALIQKSIRINSLLASILMVFMLYSINFKVMGKPNISLLESETLLAKLQINDEHSLLLVTIGITLLLLISLITLLRSKFGLLLRSYGSNIKLLTSLGQYPTALLVAGLALSNSLAAFCGVLTAQISGYADLNMGTGMALTAIGTIAIGQHLIHKLVRNAKFNALFDLLSCMLGSFIYFLAMNLFLQIGVDPVYLKLILGLMLLGFLATANCSKKEINYANA
jgi:putative ABC transport system permease protein